MRWLIDGYNVIRQDPDLKGRDAERLEAGRAALLRLVTQVARRLGRDDFTVVFDGARVRGAAPSPGRVRVVFSRPPETADDVVMRLARETGTGGVVVTSDRRVQDAARRAGCTAVGAPAFVDAARNPADAEPRGAGEAEDEAENEAENEEDDAPSPRRGNPHRAGRDARNEARVLARLRGAR